MTPLSSVKRPFVKTAEQRYVCGSAFFCTFTEFLAPSVLLPSRGNFLGTLGRRVRRLTLPDTRKRVLLSRGTDFRAALEVCENAYPEVLAQAHDRDEGIDLCENKKRRSQSHVFPSDG